MEQIYDLEDFYYIPEWNLIIEKTISKDETRGKSKFARPITLGDYKERYEILKKYQAFLKAQRERK